ncbi:MAG: FkbM family methyltransferase [Nostocaceae cyanobacterium]|nr:FkbM family methyltransferase [Nostocaceae cyanobacterium]
MTQSIIQNALNDMLGYSLKLTPEFRGKWRLIRYWMNHQDDNAVKLRTLPGGEKVFCHLRVPYESMVWLEREEQTDLKLLAKLLKSGQTFVDCGANIGIWSLVAASAVKPAGEVYSFEPNPSTFQKLSNNVCLAKFKKNINLIASAVGNEQKNVLFHCDAAHNISHITNSSNEGSINISVVTIDSILENNIIHGIKIDVEGFELECLQGAEATLKRYKPWLCVEFNTLLAKVNKLSDWKVHQYLRELGYVCRQFKDAFDSSSDSILSDTWETTGYCNLYYSMK